MGYEECLKAAGAQVLAFGTFGSYQGDWIAKVVYKGKTIWIHDYYGSCSGCDAFEADIGYDSHECLNDEYYNPLAEGNDFRPNCPACQEYKEKVVAFGKKYLECPTDYDELVKKFKGDDEWDMEANEILQFLEKHKDNALIRLGRKYKKK